MRDVPAGPEETAHRRNMRRPARLRWQASPRAGEGNRPALPLARASWCWHGTDGEKRAARDDQRGHRLRVLAACASGTTLIWGRAEQSDRLASCWGCALGLTELVWLI